ncbi:MAG TPA: polyribonucleotide nucleotidyltransferase [Pseudomonadales bacterium]|nr:polyribonucleotide nucleotidyltransferase [Pseudomonadales bacterium]
MKNLVKRKGSYLITLLLALCLTGCGTIMYPERKGQISGRIDPSIAVLDGLGLLLFLVPGVIAFAVDFSNGTIYLPGGGHSHLTANEVKQLHAGKLSAAEIASRLVGKEIAGKDVMMRQTRDLPHAEQFLANHAQVTLVARR